MASPISDTVFYIKRSFVDERAPTLAGIDRGCSLTKAMYLPKAGKEDTETSYAFHCVLYSNDNFTDCLRFLKMNARLPAKGVIRVTGTGCDKYREEINEILGLDVQFIQEHLTAINGVHLFVSGISDLNECFYPDMTATQLEFDFTEEMKDLQKKMEEQMKTNDSKDSFFPFLTVLIGSGVGIFQINEDGTFKSLGGTLIGGKTLLALGSVVANIPEYDDLMEAAKSGTAGNVDTTVGEMMRMDGKSNYGNCPPEFGLFPLGKVVDEKRTIDTFEQKDRAASAVRLFGMLMTSLVMSISQAVGISKVVFAGHGIRGEALRKEIYDTANSFTPGALKIKFLRTGGTGAFGAMLIDPTPTKDSTKQ